MRQNVPVVGYYQVEPKENAYLFLKVAFSLLIIAGYLFFLTINSTIMQLIVVAIVALFIWLVLLFFAGVMKGHIKNSSVLISERQLPEIYNIVKDYAGQLDLRRVPNVYLTESGGQLNAFATRIHGRNYVILYSELLEEFYQGNEDTVRFVIAHELGHIKQNHHTKRALTFPSIIVPFLNMAYSRACEYTCDNIGAYFSPTGAVKGIATLAAGKVIHSHINPRSLIEQANVDGGFWCWFVEKISTHPRLSLRLKRVYRDEPRQAAPIVMESKKEVRSHDAYMPK